MYGRKKKKRILNIAPAVERKRQREERFQVFHILIRIFLVLILFSDYFRKFSLCFPVEKALNKGKFQNDNIKSGSF